MGNFKRIISVNEALINSPCGKISKEMQGLLQFSDGDAYSRNDTKEEIDALVHAVRELAR